MVLIVGLLVLLTGLGYSWKTVTSSGAALAVALGAPVAHASPAVSVLVRPDPTWNFLKKVRLIASPRFSMCAATGRVSSKGTLGTCPLALGQS